jgi:hypothetical protein
MLGGEMVARGVDIVIVVVVPLGLVLALIFVVVNIETSRKRRHLLCAGQESINQSINQSNLIGSR